MDYSLIYPLKAALEMRPFFVVFVSLLGSYQTSTVGMEIDGVIEVDRVYIVTLKISLEYNDSKALDR